MKNLLFTITFFILSTSVFAQDLNFGLTAGLLTSHFVGDNDDDNTEKLKVGFSAGIALWQNYDNRFLISTELRVVNKGSKYRIDSDNEIDLKLYYAQLDFIIGYSVNDKLYFGLGPYFGPRFRQESTITIFGEKSDFEDLPEADFDGGIVALVGYNLSESFKLDMRFYQGIYNQATTSDDNIFYQTFALNGTYQF